MTGSILLILFFASSWQPVSQAIPGKSLRTYGKENISIGLFVLLGNFMAVLLTTVDRLMWLILPLTQFAQYLCDVHVRRRHNVCPGGVSGISHIFQDRRLRCEPGPTSCSGRRCHLLGRGIGHVFSVHRVGGFYLPHYTASLP